MRSINVLDCPEVRGDGVHDDTRGLQAALDSGAGVVHLPLPPSHYVISQTLVLRSGQTLLADRQAVIRLADHAHAHMLTNADHGGVSRGLTVRGGIWDGNNAHQTCLYHQNGQDWRVPYDPARYLGIVMQFNGVEDLHISGLTLKDPECFGIQMGNIRRFTVEDITFDYNLLRPNMDGVHLHGNCRQGRIVNLKGDTNDDMVALNADDGWMFEISRGPITDIQVDGLWSESGYTPVRMLSSGSPIRRVRVSNVYGTFSRFGLATLSHYDVHPGEPSEFTDVVFDGIFTAKTQSEDPDLQWAARRYPLLSVGGGTLVNSLLVNNLLRTEGLEEAPPCIHIGEGARVEHLGISQVSLVNLASTPLDFLHNEGRIESLSLSNLHCRAEGGTPRGRVLRNEGSIGEQRCANVSALNMEEEHRVGGPDCAGTS